MKILKIILIVIGVIIAIPLVVALFIKNEYHVERSVTIVSPRPIVMDHIKSLQKQNEWSPFLEKDPTTEVSYAGTEGTVGSSSSWKSKDMGEGSETVTGITEGQVKTDLVFKGMMGGNATGTFDVIPSGPGTKVTWAMDGTSKYPMNIMNLMTDGFLGPLYERGLAKLKDRIENGAPMPAAAEAAN